MLDLSTQNDPRKWVGIGYKSLYYKELSEGHSDIGWLEIHAENYMMDGGPRKEMMRGLAQHYPISCHGVGLSIGAEIGLDKDHLQRLKDLMDWLKPAVFSEHLAWSTHSDTYMNDLLPLPYTKEVLARVIRHIDEVQQAVGRQMLLENPSSYMQFEESDLAEADFIRAVADATGCGLLLDVNNVFISATNMKMDARSYVDLYPTELVQEIHLGGFDEDEDDAGATLLIDAHNNPVAEPVWVLYDYVLNITGAVPTLIEWDNNLPPWEGLRSEAVRAAEHLAPHMANLPKQTQQGVESYAS